MNIECYIKPLQFNLKRKLCQAIFNITQYPPPEIVKEKNYLILFVFILMLKINNPYTRLIPANIIYKICTT